MSKLEESRAIIEKNLNSGLFKLREAIFNKTISGLLITEAEVAAILLFVDGCRELLQEIYGDKEICDERTK